MQMFRAVPACWEHNEMDYGKKQLVRSGKYLNELF